MLFSQFKKLALSCLVGVITLAVQVRPASGGMVLPGYDLLYTVSGDFQGNEFVGVPIGAFDFGSGPVNVGSTDTIIRRINGGLPSPGGLEIDVEMVALSLQSKNPLDWSSFGGVNGEFVKTVNVVDKGSKMTIFDNFTFNSILKISFQLAGLTSGELTPFIDKTFTQTNGKWSHTPSTANVDPILIPLVNFELNGVNGDNDFFTGTAFHDAGDGTHTTIDINAVPEPSSLVLFGLGTLGAGFVSRRRLRKVDAACESVI
jgi:hypothetical protein